MAKKKTQRKQARETVGWREYLSLPELGVKRIKAKIDTGARTSSLHADEIKIRRRGSKKFVEFIVHPLQKSKKKIVKCRAPLLEERFVRSSTGHQSLRPVILTEIQIGSHLQMIELNLINRDVMGFRMLLGRQAVRDHFLVDPGRSFIFGRLKKKKK